MDTHSFLLVRSFSQRLDLRYNKFDAGGKGLPDWLHDVDESLSVLISGFNNNFCPYDSLDDVMIRHIPLSDWKMVDKAKCDKDDDSGDTTHVSLFCDTVPYVCTDAVRLTLRGSDSSSQPGSPAPECPRCVFGESNLIETRAHTHALITCMFSLDAKTVNCSYYTCVYISLTITTEIFPLTIITKIAVSKTNSGGCSDATCCEARKPRCGGFGGRSLGVSGGGDGGGYACPPGSMRAVSNALFFLLLLLVCWCV
jgi:hypothetical protein